MTSDNNNGFAKLNEEMNTSRRGSFYPNNNSQTQPIFPVFGFGVSTRIRMGKFELLAERDDGSLRIGNLTFANNCHIILLVFGGFFLLAGIILTSLSYRSKPNSEIGNQNYSRSRDLNRDSSSGFDSSREEGRLAGPIFIIIGFVLMTSGLALTFVSCKLNQEAKRLEAFSSMNSHRSASNDLGSPPNDEMISTTSNSIFGGRRATLPTISQAFPLGFYLDGRLHGGFHGGQKRKNSSPPAFSPASSTPRDGGSPTATRKLSLAKRPSIQSIPIPLLSSPSFISRSRIVAPLEESSTPDNLTSSGFIFPLSVSQSRSDQPFGSIASLSSGHHCIATFPQFNAVQVQSPSNSNKDSKKDKSENKSSEHDDETNIAITIEGEKNSDLLSNLSKSTQDQVQDHQSQKSQKCLAHGLVDEESQNFLHSIHSRGLPAILIVDEDHVNSLNSSREAIFPAISTSTDTTSIYKNSPIILTSTNTPV